MIYIYQVFMKPSMSEISKSSVKITSFSDLHIHLESLPQKGRLFAKNDMEKLEIFNFCAKNQKLCHKLYQLLPKFPRHRKVKLISGRKRLGTAWVLCHALRQSSSLLTSRRVKFAQDRASE